jgi:hypothetical protein
MAKEGYFCILVRTQTTMSWGFTDEYCPKTRSALTWLRKVLLILFNFSKKFNQMWFEFWCSFIINLSIQLKKSNIFFRNLSREVVFYYQIKIFTYNFLNKWNKYRRLFYLFFVLWFNMFIFFKHFDSLTTNIK